MVSKRPFGKAFGEGKEPLHVQGEELPYHHEYEFRMAKGTVASQRRHIRQESVPSEAGMVESHGSSGDIRHETRR